MRSVNTKLKELVKVALKEEFRFFEHYPRGEDGCFSTKIEAQNKLIDGKDKREQVNTALRDFRHDTLRNSKGREDNHYGIRWKGDVLVYKAPVFENGLPLDVPPQVIERIMTQCHEDHDLLVMRTLLNTVFKAHLCYEYDFRAGMSPEEMYVARKTAFEEEILVAEEMIVLKLKATDWVDPDVKSTYEFLDIVPHPDFGEVSLSLRARASVRI